MKKVIALTLINCIFIICLDNLFSQNNLNGSKTNLFRINVHDTIVTDFNGNKVSKRSLLFNNKTIELKLNETYNISKNGQIACIREFFPKDDTTTNLILYDTNGNVTRKHNVPSIAPGVDISNNGAFALNGSNPTKLSTGRENTTYLFLYDPKGKIIYRNTESFGPTYKEAFSNSGNVFIYLTSIWNHTNDYIVKLLIFKELESKPTFLSVDLNNWPNRPSLFTTSIVIDEVNEVLKILRYGLISESPSEFEKETLYYDLNGKFLKIEKGWEI